MREEAVLLCAVLALAACGKPQAVQDAEVVRAKTHLGHVKMAVSVFLVEQGRLPATLEELERPFEGKLDKYPEGIMKGAAKDPWGNALVYEPAGPRRFLIRSFGADGKPGGSGADADLDSDHLQF